MTDSITIRLQIISAHKLIKRSLLKNPDPFAQVIFNNHIFTTNTLEKTANPIWNKSFNLELQSSKDKLEIIIWNHRLYSKKKSSAFLGSVLLTTELLDCGERRIFLSRNNSFPSKPVRGFINVELVKIDSQFIPSSLSIPKITCHGTRFSSHPLDASPPPHCHSSSRYPAHQSIQSQISRDRSVSIDELQSSPAGPSSNGGRHDEDILLPAHFDRKVSDGGKVYFVDNNNGLVHWYHPAVPKYLRKVGDFSSLGPLPTGWDSLQSDSGRVYFIDHVSRTTQYTDPRLLTALAAPDGLGTVIRKLQAAGSISKTHTGCALKMERSRSDRRKSNNPQHESLHQHTVTCSLPVNSDSATTGSATAATTPVTGASTMTSKALDKAAAITKRSQSSCQIPSFNYTASDVELNGSASPTDDGDVDCNNDLAPLPLQRRRISRPTSNYVLMNKNYIEAKLRDLRLRLKELMQRKLCIIETSRDNILEESFTAIKRLKPLEMRRRLVLKFTDEEGLDYGGVAREWLYLLSETLFSCRHGLFETNGENDGNLLRVSSLCWVNENYLRYFHFIGRIIGMAIFHGYYIDADFCKIFYKSILNRQPNLEDFRELDEAIYNSLNWMLANNIDTADLNLTFSVEQEVFGELQTIDLCDNGRNIPVTDNVKRHYIDRYVEYNLVEKCAEQYSYIKKGIFDVLPPQSLDNLNEDEFEVLLTGISEIKIEDWQKNTRLKHCIESEPLIKWFWEVVTSYTEQQRTKLLQFVTGSSRIPLSGFEGLRGSYGSDEPKLFTIKVIRNASPQSLPKAHTCFNRLDLPLYTTYKSLHEKLTCAIEETCGFAVM